MAACDTPSRSCAACRSDASTGYQSRRVVSPSPATSNGAMACSDVVEQALARCVARLAGRECESPLGDPAQGRSEHRIRVQQEATRPIRLPEATNRLGIARGGEVQRRQALEQREVRHRGVQGRHQAFGGVEFLPSCPAHIVRVPPRARFQAMCPRAREPAARCQAGSRGKPVDSRGSMTPAADGSSAQSRPATTAVRCATRGAWTNGRDGRAAANCACTAG